MESGDVCTTQWTYGLHSDSQVRDIDLVVNRAPAPYPLILCMAEKKAWILSFVSCCFEGTNFLVLFFWPGTMQDAHRLGQPPGVNGNVPYGVAFATFMAFIILGAFLFKHMVRSPPDSAGHFGQERAGSSFVDS